MRSRTSILALFAATACSTPSRNPFDSSAASGSATAADTEGGGGSANGGGGQEGGDPSGEDESGGTGDVRYDVGSGSPPGLPPGTNLDCGDLPDDAATSVGCEFMAVRVPLLANPFAPQTFGVGLGNPFDETANIVIEDMRGPGGTLREIHTVSIAPRESRLITLEGLGGVLPNENHTAAGNGFTEHAGFRITSDQPITAMQIAPVGGAPSYMPEASMLLPKRSLNDVYFGIGYEAYSLPIPLPGFAGWIVVVALEDGTTITTVGGDQTLDAFDAWTYAPDDPTGFFVGANKRVAVFGGTNCSNIPSDNGWCDHVEEQLIPVAAWGTRYVGARHPIRTSNGSPEDVYWRLVAAKDDTDVTLTPGTTVHLAKAGDYYDFSTPESFLAESDADHPFMLVQYMGGGEALYPGEQCFEGAAATGDPYMMQMIPTDQWLSELPFLTDGSYARDFVTIVRPAGVTVELECLGTIPANRFDPIPGTGFEVANIMLDMDGNGGEGSCVDGQQFISASEPVGISVGGYDCAASYGYPGGMNLDALWVPPDIPPAG